MLVLKFPGREVVLCCVDCADADLTTWSWISVWRTTAPMIVGPSRQRDTVF